MEQVVQKMESNFDVLHFINEYPGLALNETKDKVVCSYNGHEMACTEAAICSFVYGKRYKKLKEKHTSELLEKYKDHIVPSVKKARKHQLFCTLTLRHINPQPSHIEKHVNGKRFKKALAVWEECQRNGTKFAPIRGQRKRQQDSDNDSVKSSNNLFGKMNIDESGDSEDVAVDDLDDLYPPHDFASEGDSSDDSDFEFEDLEVTQDKTESKVGDKRKSKDLTNEVPDKKLKKYDGKKSRKPMKNVKKLNTKKKKS